MIEPVAQTQPVDPHRLALRCALHLLSIVLLLPGLLFAAGVLVLGRAIAQSTLWGFLGSLLVDALWILPWGLLGGIVLLAVLAGLGFSARWRWIAAAVVALLALASTTILFASGAWPRDAGELVFYVPGLAALGIGTWLVAVEAPRTPRKLPVERVVPP